MTKNKKRRILKLRNRGIGSAVLVTLVLILFFVITVMIFFSAIIYNTVLSSVMNSAEDITKLAELCGKSSSVTDAELADDLEALAETVVICGEDGSELLSVGGRNTCDLSADRRRRIDEKKDEIYVMRDTENDLLYPTDHIPYLSYNTDEFSKLLHFLTRDNGEAIPKDADVNYIIMEDDQAELRLPYWVGMDTVIGGQKCTVCMKDCVILRHSHMLSLVGMILTIVLLFAVTVIIVFVNLIASIINQNRIKKLFFTDPVTGGRNKLWFTNTGESMLAKRRFARYRYAVADIYVQKYNNFCLCHSVEEGERLLVRIGSTLSAFVGKKEICAHGESESFAVMLRYSEKADLEARIENLLRAVEATGSAHKIAVAIGVDTVDIKLGKSGRPVGRKDEDIEVHYNNACTARIAAANGESAWAFFDDKLAEEQRRIDAVEAKQEKALREEEFVVYYQPKYDPRTDTLRGAEALIRWQSPELGFVSPAQMIPIFEKNGFITEIDHYMIRHTARDQKRRLDAGYKCVPVSVNVSRAHFAERDLAEQIKRIVDEEGAPHELIEIELTESAFFDDKKVLIETISRLKSYGFTVSMDDFGSGYSSLNSLKDMPLDVLKLDAEFFRGENADGRGEIIVTEAIRLAKSLNMRTVAEGVEHKEQVDFLAEQDCDMIQGFYYAKPMPAEEFDKRLEQAAAKSE